MYREGDVQKALLRLGIPTDQRNSELMGICPMHLERTGREDHNPSWSINLETGVHHCFSCGYKGTLLTLVAEVQDFQTSWGRLDYEAAKTWLRSNVEIDFELLSKELEALKDSYVSPSRPLEMGEARLAVYSEPPQWALDARGLTAEACSTYTVKWDSRAETWITPIRNPDSGKLLGWQEKGQTNRTFRNRPTGVAKSSALFGLEAWQPGTMIIVESPLDVVKMTSVEIRQSTVATFGAVVSDAQVDLFRKADKLIMAFDNPNIDAAGKKAALAILAKVKTLGMECWFFNYGDSGVKDVGDMTADRIRYGIENAKHCVFGERAIYGF